MTLEEFKKVYDEASDFLKPILVTAIITAMKRGEILNLKWNNLNFEGNYILVEEAKNNEPRYIPLNKELKELLKSVKLNAYSE